MVTYSALMGCSNSWQFEMFYWFWDRDGLESARINIQDLVYPGMCHHRAASLTMSDIQDLVHPGMCHHWAASLTMSHIVSKFGTRNLMASKCPFKNLYKLEKSKSQPFLTLTDTAPGCALVSPSCPSFLSAEGFAPAVGCPS